MVLVSPLTVDLPAAAPLAANARDRQERGGQ
jgi:hypothetical protein